MNTLAEKLIPAKTRAQKLMNVSAYRIANLGQIFAAKLIVPKEVEPNQDVSRPDMDADDGDAVMR